MTRMTRSMGHSHYRAKHHQTSFSLSLSLQFCVPGTSNPPKLIYAMMEGIQNLGNALYQVSVEFPYSAYAIPRQPYASNTADQTSSTMASSPHQEAGYKLKEEICSQCQSSKSVLGLLETTPSMAAAEAWNKLYEREIPHLIEMLDTREIGKGVVSPEELQRAKVCGKWGDKEPSELFLRVSSVGRKDEMRWPWQTVDFLSRM
jgi:hypothetical protein